MFPSMDILVPEMSFQVAAAHWVDSLNLNVSHRLSGGTKHQLENLNIEMIDFYYWKKKKQHLELFPL